MKFDINEPSIIKNKYSKTKAHQETSHKVMKEFVHKQHFLRNKVTEAKKQCICIAFSVNCGIQACIKKH